MRLLVARHHDVDGLGLLGPPFAAAGFDVDDWLVPNDAARVVDADDYAAVVVLGSTDSVYGEGASGWIDAELDVLRAAVEHDVPVFGVCFGAQALCAALGGVVEAAPAVEVGWLHIEPATGSPIAPGPWFEFHGDRCLVPAGVEVLATTAVAVQAFRQGPHLGVQFHPEVDAAQLDRWYGTGADHQAAAHRVDPVALMARTVAEEAAAAERAAVLVAGFLAAAGLPVEMPV